MLDQLRARLDRRPATTLMLAPEDAVEQATAEGRGVVWRRG